MSVLPEIDLEFTERATGCGQKVKNRSLLRNCGVKLVAWGGIEPPTRGFSIAVLNFYPVFIRVTARKRVT